MNKFIASMCALAVLFSISACTTTPQNVNVSGQTDEQFKEQGPVWTQELLQGYLNREPDSVMAYAGPFYFGSFDGMAPASQAFSEQRRLKVDEILQVIDEGIEVMVKLDKKLREEREIFAWYIKEIQTIDEDTKSYTDQVLGATKGSILSEGLSTLMLMNRDASKMEESAERGFLQFQVYGNWIELTNLYSVEAASLMSRATAMYYLLESDPNTAYKDLNVQFTAKMDPVSEQASELLSELYYMTALARNGEKIVFTADYNFARETVKDIDEQIAKAQKTFDEYKGGNELVSENMTALLEEQLNNLSAYRDNIVAYLDSIPAEELVSEGEFAMVEGGTSFALVPIAMAQSDPAGWFQQKVTDSIKAVKFVKDMSLAAVRLTGKKVKETYDESGAHEVVKDGAQIVSGGIEIVNSGVEVSIYGLQGIYYKDMSWADFKKKIEDEKKELHQRFIEGKLGKDQFNEMIHQMDLFKNSTDRFVNDISELAGDMTGILVGEPKVGKFVKNVTRSVGNEAKGALDTATEFSKNLAIVMHPETSKEETRNAILNIYTALKSARDDKGKAVEVDMPDLVDITKEKAMEEAIKELGLEQEEEKEFIAELKEMFVEQLKEKETKGEEQKDETGEDTDGAESDEPGEEDKEDASTGEDDGTAGDDDSTTGESGDEDASSDDDSIVEGATPAERVMNQLRKNPNLTQEEVANIIITEIMRDLPPLKSKEQKEEDAEDSDGDGIADADDNCPDTANDDQLDTDGDGLGDACDPDCTGDKDGDEVCDEIDNCPSDPNADQKDADNDGMGNVCDLDAPNISEIAGTWPGSIVVTEVYVSDAMRAQAEEEGCDISELEQAEGRVIPVEVTITPESETGGTMLLIDQDGDAHRMPFTYIDGVLRASKSEEGATMSFEMGFGRSVSNGTVDMNFMDGQATMQADIDLEQKMEE